MERQPDLLSPDLWDCLTPRFSEPAQKPQATVTRSVIGKTLTSESACSLSVPIWVLAQPCLQAICR